MVLQDDPDWHRGDSEKYETEGEGELYEFGQECLDRLALSLGGNTVAPLASQMFQPLMASQAPSLLLASCSSPPSPPQNFPNTLMPFSQGREQVGGGGGNHRAPWPPRCPTL